MAARLWIPVLSVLSGVAIVRAAPAAWGVAPFHGALLGAALFIAALRRRTGLVARAAAFLALAAVQVYVLFIAAPGADLRATFIVLSTWIVIESVAGRTERGGGRSAGGY